MTDHDPYETWLSERLDVETPHGFSERVMGHLDSGRLDAAQPTQVERLLSSPPLRLAVSVAALAVGLSRFLYLALQAKLIAF